MNSEERSYMTKEEAREYFSLARILGLTILTIGTMEGLYWGMKGVILFILALQDL